MVYPRRLDIVLCAVKFVCVCVCVRVQMFTCAQLCLTLCKSMDYITCQAPLSIEFSRQEYWSGLPFPLPGYLPNPGIKPAIEPESLVSPALAGRFFTTVPPGKPMLYGRTLLFIHSKCNSLHLLTPSSQFILLPLPLP